MEKRSNISFKVPPRSYPARLCPFTWDTRGHQTQLWESTTYQLGPRNETFQTYRRWFKDEIFPVSRFWWWEAGKGTLWVFEERVGDAITQRCFQLCVAINRSVLQLVTLYWSPPSPEINCNTAKDSGRNYTPLAKVVLDARCEFKPLGRLMDSSLAMVELTINGTLGL